jgi:AbrB family looped-hinge helix DNA binding protein
MRVAIDNAGRLVLPKALRAELGISGSSEVDIVSANGRLEISVPEIPAHLEMRDGLATIVPDRPMPPLTADEVRDVLERVRR